jgi:glycosyltransferase involved in cell wall biosynthesis
VRRPKVLFVGRTRYLLPLPDHLARKWDALSERMEVRVLASGSGHDARFRLVPPRHLDGPRFYLSLPFEVAAELRSFRPDVVVAESPYEAVAVELARRAERSPAKLVVEVHGDWRTSTRLYGSRWRAPVAPVGDLLARWAVRSADGHRALSAFTASLVRAEGREPLGVFPTYSDLGAFSGPPAPMPAEPRALFVGVLERYKAVDVLAAAWRLVAARLPAARLRLVGMGTETAVAEALVREGAEWDRRLAPAGVAAALDGARVLVLPSPAEGLGRVAIEAFLRGRPVVGTRAGGIPDVVEHGRTGLLVAPGDVYGLADSIERMVGGPGRAAQMGQAARAASAAWLSSPEEFAERVLAVVQAVTGRPVAPPAGDA